LQLGVLGYNMFWERTFKLDVWSLFAMMLWTLDVGGVRHGWHQFKSAEDVQEAVLFAASEGNISKVQEIARNSLEERASVADTYCMFRGWAITGR
jgi:hypothetical protein